MSHHLYFAVEGRPRGQTTRWRFMQRLPNPGSTREVHAALGLDGEGAPAAVLQLRGLPNNVDDETLAEDAFFIDDALAETDAGDCVDARFCSEIEAREWEEAGEAVILSADRVTSPHAFGHSWATAAELEVVLPPEGKDSAVVSELRHLVKTMRYLEAADIEVRAVYWFE